MAREKKPVHKVQMTDGKRNIIQQLLQEYDIQSAEDIQDSLKDLIGGTIKEMMEAEMDDHLGYEKSERSDSDDYRNGYKSKPSNSIVRTAIKTNFPIAISERCSHNRNSNLKELLACKVWLIWDQCTAASLKTMICK